MKTLFLIFFCYAIAFTQDYYRLDSYGWKSGDIFRIDKMIVPNPPPIVDDSLEFQFWVRDLDGWGSPDGVHDLVTIQKNTMLVGNLSLNGNGDGTWSASFYSGILGDSTLYHTTFNNLSSNQNVHFWVKPNTWISNYFEIQNNTDGTNESAFPYSFMLTIKKARTL